MGRWLLFIIAILVGIGAGLLYGWEINQIEFSNAPFETLKVDYQADYALMVAEIFTTEADLSKAIRRLTAYESLQPVELVRQAIRFSEQAGYADRDMESLKILLTALEEAASPVQTAAP